MKFKTFEYGPNWHGVTTAKGSKDFAEELQFLKQYVNNISDRRFLERIVNFQAERGFISAKQSALVIQVIKQNENDITSQLDMKKYLSNLNTKQGYRPVEK